MSEECLELQQEEAEVLTSIYDGDPAFVTVKAGEKYQYKLGDTEAETAGKHALLVEFEWVAEYPNVLPKINLDIFFNRDISPAIKQSVISAVKEEAEQYLGMSMTFSLVEYLKENFDTLMADQPEHVTASSVTEVSEALDNLTTEDNAGKAGKEKKEQLTKAQKRARWKQGGLDAGDRERGWNWVDVIRHLSQTGGKPEGS